MFNKILVANRGEIACRVMRTARKLGVRTVAVYSDADKNAQHVKQADEAVRIGPSLAAQSYLRGDIILEVAARTGAQAIHPGYGFLSENAKFALMCEEAGVSFIGPPASAIESMGSKSESKKIMIAAGVPVTPGYHGADQDDARLLQEAEKIGFPVMIKAVKGGGGKGMRIARTAAEFLETLQACRREAMASFSDDVVLIEKYVIRPRHVEFQVFADKHGNAVHIFERDCSVQRRHQKVLEESPAPGMTPELRASMGASAVAAAQAVGYVGAGTVEFILTQDHQHYFMEMNTRLQVEHPVTEMISGLDLVEWQLRVAAGQTLPLTQRDLVLTGCALEARIYAERPGNNYLPATGRLIRHRPPAQSPSVRVDSGITQGDSISTFYDPMIAKMITYGPSRDVARQLMDRALEEYQVVGLPTNIEFLRKVVKHEAFAEGGVDTGFLERYAGDVVPKPAPAPSKIVALAALSQLLTASTANATAAASSGRSLSPWSSGLGSRPMTGRNIQFKLVDSSGAERVAIVKDGVARNAQFAVTVGSETFDVSTSATAEDGGHPSWRFDFQDAFLSATVVVDGSKLTVLPSGGFPEATYTFELPTVSFGAAGGKGSSGTIITPMPGRVVKVSAKPGDAVEAGTTLMILEAMKMEHTIKAPFAGVVQEIRFAEGGFVQDGDILLKFVDKPAS